MNLEQLCRAVKENSHRLKNEKKALLYIRYQFELLAWKRQKLKLGAIVFDIKQTIFAGFLLGQEIEMRYIRQDTSHEDELTLEFRLNALKWKWDFSNIVALAFVFLFTFFFMNAIAYLWYQDNMPDIAFREDKFNDLVKLAFNVTFNYANAIFFRFSAISNLWLIETLTAFCAFYDFLF